MSQEKIFEFLNEKPCDFPRLKPESADSIAGNMSDIIYDSLKLKSSAPTTKRLQILSLLKNCSGKHGHYNVTESNFPIFLKALEPMFPTNSNHAILEDFLEKLNGEIEDRPNSLLEQVQDFHMRKNKRRKANGKLLEIIKQFDQKSLNEARFQHRITQKISHHQTSENLIRNLLRNSLPSADLPKTDVQSIVYREKQIKFAYALFNLKQWQMLQVLLKRLSRYEKLTQLEINFVEFLNNNEVLDEILIKHFMFIYEKIVIRICTKILALRNSENIDNFIENLSLDSEIMRIANLAKNHREFRFKINHMLFELYNLGDCNSNLIRFRNFLLK